MAYWYYKFNPFFCMPILDVHFGFVCQGLLFAFLLFPCSWTRFNKWLLHSLKLRPLIISFLWRLEFLFLWVKAFPLIYHKPKGLPLCASGFLMMNLEQPSMPSGWAYFLQPFFFSCSLCFSQQCIDFQIYKLIVFWISDNFQSLSCSVHMIEL